MDENTLLKYLKADSREALAVLWERHSKNMLNLAFKMLKNATDAEDTLMDIFVQVPKAIKGFKGESALSTWLFRLTVNACLMKLRSNRRHSEIEEREFDYIAGETFGSYENSDSLAIQKSKAKLLENGLLMLPTATRSMLWLKDAEGLDIADLCEIYRMPEGTIKARLSRARRFVRDYLKGAMNHG